MCVVLTGCGGSDAASAPTGRIAVRSPAFANGQPIPAAYTCTGKEISPPLSWSGVPKGTLSLKLDMNDLSAHFVHWKVRGIDPGVTSVAAGTVPKGGKQGRNSFNKVGYGGPCPPRATTPIATRSRSPPWARTGRCWTGARWWERSAADAPVKAVTTPGAYVGVRWETWSGQAVW